MINNKGSVIYVKAPVANTIHVYDLISGSIINQISLSETMRKSAYKNFLGREEYDLQMKRMQEIQVPEVTSIVNLFVFNDTLFAVSECNYVADISQPDEKTIVNAFYAISKIVNNKEVDVAYTQMFTSDTSFIVQPKMMQLGSSVFAAVEERKKTGWGNKRHMAVLNRNGDRYEIDSVLPYRLNPKFYVSLNYTNPLFDKKYYMMPLEAKVRDLVSGDVVVDLSIFDSINNTSPSIAEPAKRFVYTFKFNEKEGLLWLIYCNNETNNIHCLKYDVKRKKVLGDIEFGNYFNISNIGISDFNFNYIYFAVKDKVTFKRIF